MSGKKNETPEKIIRCGDGCVFCVEVYMDSKNNNSRKIKKHKCLLGHGRGNFVNKTDFCSWARTEKAYFQEINDIIKINGRIDIGKYDHFSPFDDDSKEK